MDFPFLARITCSDRFGTGILVAPDRLLTCAHVATRFDPDRPSASALMAGRDDITLYFPEVAQSPGFSCRATVVDASHEDLALLALERPCQRAPLRVYRLAADLIQSPDYEVRRIAGFAGPDDTLPTTVTFEGLLLSAETNELIEFQTAGGLPAGMSGSPLFARMGQAHVCLGMALRGGRNVSHSRFIGPARLLAFLYRTGIDAELREGVQTTVSTPEGVNAADESLHPAGVSDPLLLLRPLQLGSISCQLIPVRVLRGLVAKAGARPVFRPGAHVTVHVSIPHACDVTFINVERVDSSDRRYEVIGLDLLPGELPGEGFHRLPRSEPLVITNQQDSCSLVMLAWTRRSGWQGIRPAARTREVTEQELYDCLRVFRAIPAAERHVSIFDYDVR